MPGATMRHDFVISDIDYLIREKHHGIKIGQSTEIGGLNSRRPDISVWRTINPELRHFDEKNYEPIVTIEIARHRRHYAYSMEAILDAFTQAPTIRESFIYSIYNNTWTKVFRTGSTAQSSKCQTLDLDFRDALEG